MSLTISGRSQVSVSITANSPIQSRGPAAQGGVRGGAELANAAANLMLEFTKFALQALQQLQKAGGAQGGSPAGSVGQGSPASGPASHCGCPHTPSAPSPSDSSHPAGSLKADENGVVTTPGGYKIEATKQHEWKITGPDGKSTRVWGDPHVDEGDGGKWDFKRDSTFVLGDGTRINCATTPTGNGMTVTKGLEIISGNDRVQISDIDKGKGKTGQVTQDGFAHANSFGNKDVFVMGKETDDWSFQGKEVIGSNNGGESFKLGNELAAGNTPPTAEKPTEKPASRLEQLTDLFRSLSRVFDSLRNLTDRLSKPGQNTGVVPPGRENAAHPRRGALERAFSQIGRMLDVVTQFQKLSQSINAHRHQALN